MSDINKKAQQAKAKAEKRPGKTVTKQVAPGLVYKIKIVKEKR